jgi:lipopolysaccharide exporter
MKSGLLGKLVGAVGGQSLFLLTNMLSFLAVVKIFRPEEFAAWGFYLSLMALVDGIRQGLIQNGLTRFLVHHPEAEKPLLGSALVLHLGFIAFSGLLLFLFAPAISSFWEMPAMEVLLRYSWLSLLGTGSMQGLFSLLFAKGKSSTYFYLNLIYLLLSSLGIWILYALDGLELLALLWVQSGISIGLAVVGLSMGSWLQWGRPTRQWILDLLAFGKHVAGTNAFSLLFQKADLWMIGYFLDAQAVALFLLATKIIQYIDLPISSLSQLIYPRLAATGRSKAANDLNFEVARAILLLFVLILPGVLLVLVFSEPIILILSTQDYLEAAPVVILLALASLAKPWGRVFGMALDASGRPEVNLQMLALSLAINVAANALLIPVFGLVGAAAATSLSTVLTILIGQLRIRKYLEVVSFRKQLQLIWIILTAPLNFKKL